MLAFLSLVAIMGWKLSLVLRRPADIDHSKGPPDAAAVAVVATWNAEFDLCARWFRRVVRSLVGIIALLVFLLALRADICDAGSEAPRLEVLAWVVGIL